MPSSFVSGFHGLPPTPPHVYNGGSRMESDPSLYAMGHSGFPPPYSQSGCEFIDQYSQAACYSKASLMNLQSQHAQTMLGGRDIQSARAALSQHGPNAPIFGHLATAPVLPPLRTNIQLPPMENAAVPQYARQDQVTTHVEKHRKEEKSTGGVAVHLDYEMEQMSDFVAEMAQGIVCPGSPVPSQFRKFVFQILSSTRLPSSTIILGLYYLASRMRMLSSAGIYNSGSGQIYRMLTLALLLGSKFLDDNTFQNKSWAEVSNISVAELNAMELDWLFAFDWKLHDRIYDKQDGFATWLNHWETWRGKVSTTRVRDSRRSLAPIDTNIVRGHSNSIPKPLMSPEGPIPPQYQRNSHLENSWLNPAASEYSPPSAPHSGPNTPDYYSVGPWAYANPPPPYSRTWVGPHKHFPPPAAPRSQPPSYHHTPAYALPFAQSVWTGHGSSCGCLYCAKHLEHYMCANVFGSIQPVVAG